MLLCFTSKNQLSKPVLTGVNQLLLLSPVIILTFEHGNYIRLMNTANKDLVVIALDGPFLAACQCWLQIASLPLTLAKSP